MISFDQRHPTSIPEHKNEFTIHRISQSSLRNGSRTPIYGKFASVVFDVWCAFALEPLVLVGSHWMVEKLHGNTSSARACYHALQLCASRFNSTCLISAV